jgi:hypothetical protein
MMRKWLIVLFAYGLIVSVAGVVYQRRFEAMSPAEHLQAAKAALKDGYLDDGLRHLKVIGESAPQTGEARKVAEDIEAALGRKSAAAQAKLWANARRASAVRDLQSSLRNWDMTLLSLSHMNPAS